MPEKRVSKVVMWNPKIEKFLFFLRDNKDWIPYPNKWSMLGGIVEPDENPKETAIREVKEEINYMLDDVLFLFEMPEPTEQNKKIHMFLGFIKKNLDELVLNEGQKLGYFSWQEIESFDAVPYLKEFMLKNRKLIESKCR